MNYFVKINDLIKELLTFKQFKRMQVVFRIFAYILTAPLYVAAFSIICVYYLYIVGYRFLSLPADILNKFIKEEGKEVHFITQAVIYFVCFPFIFVLNISLAFCSLSIAVLYFIITLLLQVASLNGITFKPFIIDEVERDFNQLSTISKINQIFFIAMSYLLIVLCIVFGLLESSLSTVFIILFILFIIICPLFVFKKDMNSKEINRIFAYILIGVLTVVLITGITLLCIDKIEFNRNEDGNHNATYNLSIYVNEYDYYREYTESVYVEYSGYYTISLSEECQISSNGTTRTGSVVGMHLNEGSNIIEILDVIGNTYTGYVYITITYSE